MKVELVRMTTNPVEAIEMAASNCYDSTPSNDGRVMNACYQSGHHSVLEFAVFHFHVEGVSRALLAQLTRHRMAGYAVRSQRYVAEDNFQYVIPPTIAKNPIALSAYMELMDRDQEKYNLLTELGIPAEDARFVIPNSCTTVVDITMNLRSLIHFMNERLCTRSQWEIRELAKRMKKVVISQVPQLEKMLCPKCESNIGMPFCTESSTCGRHPTLKSVYGMYKVAKEKIECHDEQES